MGEKNLINEHKYDNKIVMNDKKKIHQVVR